MSKFFWACRAKRGARSWPRWKAASRIASDRSSRPLAGVSVRLFELFLRQKVRATFGCCRQRSPHRFFGISTRGRSDEYQLGQCGQYSPARMARTTGSPTTATRRSREDLNIDTRTAIESTALPAQLCEAGQRLERLLAAPRNANAGSVARPRCRRQYDHRCEPPHLHRKSAANDVPLSPLAQDHARPTHGHNE